jgi:16S rRNA (cytosine967-C5)-methyltransferase
LLRALVSVQDAAAQVAAPLLLEGPASPPTGAPLRLLDACAAPGGKTAHLLELVDADVTGAGCGPAALRTHPWHPGAPGPAGQVVVADAEQTTDWWDGPLFDAILLDAPCTASGIVRRHPDVRWLRRPTDIDKLAAIQARLLRALWPLVRPGGRLLYCTCSVFRAEGEMQVQTFVAHNTDAVLLPAPGHLVPQTPASPKGLPDNQHGDHDGFFYALLGKRAA